MRGPRRGVCIERRLSVNQQMRNHSCLRNSLQKKLGCFDWPKTMAYACAPAVQVHEHEHKGHCNFPVLEKDYGRIACAVLSKDDCPLPSLTIMSLTQARI